MTDEATGRAPDDRRPDTPTGRPDPLGPDPTRAELRRERQDLKNSNAGRFTVEEPQDRNRGPVVVQVHNNTTTTVLILLCVLHTIKLVIVVWILMLSLQVLEYVRNADAQRLSLATDTSLIKNNLAQVLAQQDVLVKRVDDALHAMPK